MCEVLLMQMTSALPVGASDNDRTHFQLAVRGVLEDAQERLIYRVQACCLLVSQNVYLMFAKLQALVTTEIETHVPSSKDIDYPERLERPSVPATPSTPSASDSAASRTSSTIDDAYKDWFPTLRLAMSLLSKLYRCVNVSPRICLFFLLKVILQKKKNIKGTSFQRDLAPDYRQHANFAHAGVVPNLKAKGATGWAAVPDQAPAPAARAPGPV